MLPTVPAAVVGNKYLVVIIAARHRCWLDNIQMWSYCFPEKMLLEFFLVALVPSDASHWALNKKQFPIRESPGFVRYFQV